MATSGDHMMILHCSICLEQFKNPKILSCFHTFCELCLDSHILKSRGRNTFLCPICRCELVKPAGGAKDFQSNFYVCGADERSKTTYFCDLCDPETKAVCHCVECSQNLCDSCRIYHKKIKSTTDHTVSDLHVATSSEDRVETASLTAAGNDTVCTVHSFEQLNIFCRTCKLPICTSCKSMHHKRHFTEPVDVAVKKERKRFSNTMDKSRSLVSWMNLLKQDEADNADCSTVLQQIDKQAELLKSEVEKARQIARGRAEAIVYSGNQNPGALEESAQMLSSAISIAETWIKHASNVEVLAESGLKCKEVSEKQSKLKLNTSSPGHRLQFKEGFINQNLLGKMLGSVLRVEDTGNPRRVHVQRESTFPSLHPDALARCICPQNNGFAWISVFGVKGTVLFDNRGEQQCSLFLDGDDNVDSIAVDERELLYVSCVDSGQILKHNKAGQCIYRIQVKEFPRGVAILKDGTVVVCLVGNKTLQKHNPIHRNGIAFLDQKGTEIKYISPKGLFEYPYRVAVCSLSGNIAVTDVVDPAVHLFSSTGKHFATYRNLGSVEDVTFDKYGHILITEMDKNYVHLIDSDGNFLCYLLSEKNGIDRPSALAVDEDCHLWVGCLGLIHVFRYLKEN